MTRDRSPSNPASRNEDSASVFLWVKALLMGLGVATSSFAVAQTAAGDTTDPLTVLPAQTRFGIERLRLPGRERMGLVGTSYMAEVLPNVMVGPALYGAVSGQRGGLFILGAEAAWRHRLAGPLGVEVGLFAGGGGGGSAPVGGGLMLRPHADLLWDFGPYRAGLSLSQVRFPDGQISSRQVGLVWSANTEFRYVSRDRIGSPSSISGRSGMGFDRAQTVFGAYHPRSRARRASGGAMPSSISYVGIRMERALGDHAYAGLEAGGAASGGVAGYAEYLGTAGTESGVWGDRLVLGTRVALGMGGGGDVDVGGGLLLKGAVYGTVRLTRSLGLSIEGGMTRAPQASFRAFHTAASLNWILDDPSDVTAPERNTRTEWTIGVERYDADRKDGTRRPLRAVTLKTHRFVTNHLYLAGQGHSAYEGGAGGYSAGMVGAGVQTSLWQGWHAGAEALVGAGGGGGVDTGSGVLVQPMAYVGFDLSRSLALRLAGGRVKAAKGSLNSKVLDLALVFTFGVAGHGQR